MLLEHSVSYRGCPHGVENTVCIMGLKEKVRGRKSHAGSDHNGTITEQAVADLPHSSAFTVECLIRLGSLVVDS